MGCRNQAAHLAGWVCEGPCLVKVWEQAHWVPSPWQEEVGLVVLALGMGVVLALGVVLLLGVILPLLLIQ